MWDLIKAIIVVVLSLGALLGFLGLLYWLTTLLPAKWQEGWKAWVFLLPAMIGVLFGLFIPAIKTVYNSFLDDAAQDFVGFDNYREIFSNTGTRLTVFNSLVWVVIGTAITVVVALAVARYADNIKGEKAAKSAIFIPGAVSLIG